MQPFWYAQRLTFTENARTVGSDFFVLIENFVVCDEKENSTQLSFLKSLVLELYSHFIF